jgi:hypothetical protein
VNILNWLEKWYQSNCDTNWEHLYGIKISTLDNPGWMVNINLTDTPLIGKVFENVHIDNGDDDWITCRVINDIYEGFGDSFKFEKILRIFKEWVDM